MTSNNLFTNTNFDIVIFWIITVISRCNYLTNMQIQTSKIYLAANTKTGGEGSFCSKIALACIFTWASLFSEWSRWMLSPFEILRQMLQADRLFILHTFAFLSAATAAVRKISEPWHGCGVVPFQWIFSMLTPELKVQKIGLSSYKLGVFC